MRCRDERLEMDGGGPWDVEQGSLPLIFAGGPTATSNPEPYSAFCDYFALVRPARLCSLCPVLRTASGPRGLRVGACCASVFVCWRVRCPCVRCLSRATGRTASPRSGNASWQRRRRACRGAQGASHSSPPPPPPSLHSCARSDNSTVGCGWLLLHRRETLLKLAREVKGVYVPMFYDAPEARHRSPFELFSFSPLSIAPLCPSPAPPCHCQPARLN